MVKRKVAPSSLSLAKERERRALAKKEKDERLQNNRKEMGEGTIQARGTWLGRLKDLREAHRAQEAQVTKTHSSKLC